MNVLDELDSPYERAMYLQSALVSRATGGAISEEGYVLLRQEFMSNPSTKNLLPIFLRTSRSADQFWSFIKAQYATYEERRQFLYQELNPLLAYLEQRQGSPASSSISVSLEKFDKSGVHSLWDKALSRVSVDPEGAITAARSMLESTCKHILDEAGASYDGDKIELPALYKRTSDELNLAPSQHTQEVFKQILGSCAGVVAGLGTLRSRIGDAHGQGRNPVRPARRHAELAVNLAGTMATFLVETAEAKKTC